MPPLMLSLRPAPSSPQAPFDLSALTVIARSLGRPAPPPGAALRCHPLDWRPEFAGMFPVDVVIDPRTPRINGTRTQP